MPDKRNSADQARPVALVTYGRHGEFEIADPVLLGAPAGGGAIPVMMTDSNGVCTSPLDVVCLDQICSDPNNVICIYDAMCIPPEINPICGGLNVSC